jgi:hypothetical protein
MELVPIGHLEVHDDPTPDGYFMESRTTPTTTPSIAMLCSRKST